MANITTLRPFLTAIANAIRTASGVTGTINAQDFSAKITELTKLNLQSKSVVPSTSEQTLTPDSGYNGLSSVKVNAVATDTLTASQNGTYDQSSNTTFWNKVVVNVPATVFNTQEKTATPKSTSQSIIPDSGYDGLSKVTVDAVPTETKTVTPSSTSQSVTPTSGKWLEKVTVGAVPTESKSATPSSAEQSITPTSGKWLSQVTISAVPTESKTATPTTSSQTITATVGKWLSQVVVNAIQTETKSVALSMATGNLVITSSSGKYLTQVTVEKPATLLAENIKEGISIGGVWGTYKGSDNPLIATTDTEMSAYLVQDNVGRVAKFTGTSGTYATNEFYLIYDDAYSVTYQLDNVTGNSGNPTKMDKDTAYTVAFTANNGYTLPESVRVVGAEGYSWNATTGVLMVRNATSNVTIYVAGVSSSSEVWLFNDSLSTTTNYELEASFVSNNERFDKIMMLNIDGNTRMWYSRNTTDEVYVYNNAWTDEGYKTISLDVSASGDLSTFLQSYATNVVQGYNLTISRTDDNGAGDMGIATLLINNKTTYELELKTNYNFTESIQNVKTLNMTNWMSNGTTVSERPTLILNNENISYNTEYELTSDSNLVAYHYWCFVEGTQITLLDGTTKSVEDIDYDDFVMTWNFDVQCQYYRNVCWISKEGVASYYWKITLSDGTILKLVGVQGKSHRLFNATKGKFMYPQDFDKDDVNEKGCTIVSCEKVYETVKFYNLMSEHDINCYANGVLTGNRFCNIYPIKDMRYIKDGRKRRSREEYAEIPDRIFWGLRLDEQPIQDDKPDNVNYYHTMKEHIIHGIVENERDYDGKGEYEPRLRRSRK